MNKKYNRVITDMFLSFMLLMTFCSCGKKNDEADTLEIISNNPLNVTTEQSMVSEIEVVTGEKLSDEQALSAIKNYCYIINPDLKSIVEAKEYPVYWEISSSDEDEIVVLFRSYTGAQNKYYIDRVTGDTYITEYVPGIMVEEEMTDERFDVRDYL